jgi:uncharacterized protein YdaU (DUF1376 family)
MNYYPFHLGDYASHTAHLEPMEDLAYRRMLDLYYRTEKPLPDAEDVARLIRMREFTAEVMRVLCEFFKNSPQGWTHSRCERELSSFAAMVEGGKKGAAKRWGKPKDAHPIATPSIPQWQPEPEPEPKKESPHASHGSPFVLPAWIPVDAWDAFIAMRKAKGKRAPFTDAARNGIIAELGKLHSDGHNLRDALNESVINGWSGVFAPKRAKSINGRSVEPEWRTEQRERNEAFLGPAAARRTTNTVEMEIPNADARRLG